MGVEEDGDFDSNSLLEDSEVVVSFVGGLFFFILPIFLQKKLIWPTNYLFCFHLM